MDFTREPLVETVITPREGFRLIIRPSNRDSQEEYAVSAVEIVSFGNCFFFRSLEKPKEFLLPMTAYEVVETRETRTVLKKPQIEKSIKIGGGKKNSDEEEPEKEEVKKQQRDNNKKRGRKRFGRGEREETKEEASSPSAPETEKSAQPKSEQTPPPVRRTLLPPPTSLISDQIDRYKQYLTDQGVLSNDTGAKEETPSSPEPKIVDITEEARTPSEGKDEI